VATKTEIDTLNDKLMPQGLVVSRNPVGSSGGGSQEKYQVNTMVPLKKIDDIIEFAQQYGVTIKKAVE
jgi:hypothetical protein